MDMGKIIVPVRHFGHSGRKVQMVLWKVKDLKSEKTQLWTELKVKQSILEELKPWIVNDLNLNIRQNQLIY